MSCWSDQWTCFNCTANNIYD